MQILVCSSCDVKWKRKPQRGRKPSVCPDCKSGTLPQNNKVQEVAGEKELYTDMLIRKYGYKPPKKTVWCDGDNHKYCGSIYKEDYKYRCRCKCHA